MRLRNSHTYNASGKSTPVDAIDENRSTAPCGIESQDPARGTSIATDRSPVGVAVDPIHGAA